MGSRILAWLERVTGIPLTRSGARAAAAHRIAAQLADLTDRLDEETRRGPRPPRRPWWRRWWR